MMIILQQVVYSPHARKLAWKAGMKRCAPGGQERSLPGGTGRNQAEAQRADQTAVLRLWVEQRYYSDLKVQSDGD